MRIASMLVGGLFAVGALLQLDDPDPVGWFALYAVAAAASWVAPARPARWTLAVLVGVAALVWAGLLAPRVVPTFEWSNLLRDKDPRLPVIEESRELLGLLLIAAWMAVRATALARTR